MTIGELERSFLPVVRQRGARYRQDDAVLITAASATAIRATVKGDDRYIARIARAGTSVVLACTCRAFDSLGPCKHLWATVLEANDLQLLSMVIGLCTEVSDGAAGGRWADRLCSGEKPDGTAAPSSPRGGNSSAGKSVAPAWAALFARTPPARVATQPAPSFRGEILYVVEAEQTRQNGELTVTLRTRIAKKKGGAMTERAAAVPAAALESLADERDRRALPLFQAAAMSSASGRYLDEGYHTGYGYVAQIATEAVVSPALGRQLLPLLAATGRLFVRPAPGGELASLAYQADPPWDFVLSLERQAEGPAFEITGRLERDGESRPLSAAPVVTSSGWLLFPDALAHGRYFEAFDLLRALRERDRLPLAAGDETAFLATLYEQPSLPRLAFPKDLALDEVAGKPVPRLTIAGGAVERDGGWLTATLSFLYLGEGTELAVSTADPRLVIPDMATRRLLRRDEGLERQAADKLVEIGFRHHAEPWNVPSTPPRYQVTRGRLHAVVAELLAAGWRVEAEGKPYRRPGRFDLSVTSGVDWFDLDARVDFDGMAVALPDLLRALRRGDGLIVLGDGSLGMLPADWLKKYAPLADLGTAEGERLRFRPAQAGLLDLLLASQPEVSVDAMFAKARERLQTFTGVAVQAAPPGFRGQLRPYQEAGLGWFAFLRQFGFGGCLADDMGLGKTIQVLAMLGGRPRRRARPSIVVVPKSLVWNWQNEAARFAPELRVLTHVGAERASSAAALRKQLATTDVLLTTYGILRKDAAFLHEVEADYVILDEAQAIKNPTSESAKAARLLQGDHRLALSGTPIENHVGELWSLLDFLNPGMLGTARAFAGVAGVKRPEPEVLAALARVVRPFILRRTKEEVAPELPGKHEETILCEMEPEQRRLYDQLRRHYRGRLLGKTALPDLAKSKIQVLEALLRLRQVACHPGLVDKERGALSSGKMDVLLARLDEVRREGHKALVFSQFTTFLALVRQRLDAGQVPYAYLDGDTVDRQACVERFQADAGCPLFLLSLKAGGVGLNLTAADYVFILDPWWNPAVEAQAVDRAHRIGQTKRVFVYRLLCRDTVEEKVAALQETKRDLAASIISADGSLMRNLDRETLEALLG